MLLKDRKTGDVYELNIVNVVVECDIIYVSILYHLYRICKAGQFAGIYSPLVKSIYILMLLKVQRRAHIIRLMTYNDMMIETEVVE